MNTFFLINMILVFLTIIVEFLMFYLQRKGRYMDKWFGDQAFFVHSLITLLLWTATWISIIAFQFAEHPSFHNSLSLQIFGWTLAIIGVSIATLGYKELGLRRSLGVNFYEEGTELEESGIYKWIKNPEENGYWIMLIGLALATDSLYNLVLAIEFIVLMIPHQKLENMPVQKERKKLED